MGIFSRIKQTQAQEGQPPQQVAQVQAPAVSRRPHEGSQARDVIVRPLISEKTASLAGANQYVFVVHNDANRIEVRQAVKAMYGVSPLAVNIINVRGKAVRFGRRQGRRSDWKKAIITLPQGQTIHVYEGV